MSLTIKAQTLKDYHNHVIHLINQKISLMEEMKGVYFRAGDYKSYDRISSDIKLLDDLKCDIHYDWETSNYSKVK